MIYGHLKCPSTLGQLPSIDPWEEALEWLSQFTESSPLGITERHNGKMLISVESYQTKPRQMCCFESHAHTIDIQYMLKGSETIEWALANSLQPKGKYSKEGDRQNYEEPERGADCSFRLAAGYVAIFMKDDAHCPQIYDGGGRDVIKAVLKLDVSMVDGLLV